VASFFYGPRCIVTVAAAACWPLGDTSCYISMATPGE